MYTSKNYRTKKEVKQDVERRNALLALASRSEQEQSEFNRLSNHLTVYQPNGDLTGTSAPLQGRVYLEGPHYPEPHRWYAQGEVDGGVLVKVK